MKTAVLLTTVATAFGLATAVQAQDAAEWTGPYVGAYAGWARHSGDRNETILFDTNLDGVSNNTVNTAAGANAFSPGFCGGAANTPTSAGGCSKDDDGLEFGGRLGYDWQMGSLVVGALIEGGRMDVNDSVSAFSTTPARYAMDRKLKSLGAIRARAGYAFDRNLIYVTGGGAMGKVKHRFTTSNTVNSFTETKDDDTAKGFQLGAGAERKLTPNVSLGLEYIFTKLDDSDYTVRAGGPAPATNPFILVNANGTDFNRSNEDLEVHSVRLTLNYRF